MTHISTKNAHAEVESPDDSMPSGDAQAKQAAKARLLLNLINNGTIPAQPDKFVQDLTRIAGIDKPDALVDFGGILKSLSNHFLERNKPTSLAKNDQSAVAGQEVPDIAMVNLAGSVSSRQADKIHPDTANREVGIENFQDQHPAIICQYFEQFDDCEKKLRLRNLSGKVARQVAYLIWQK